MMYNELVTDYFFHPLHVGELTTINPFSVVVTSSAQISPFMQLSLQCDALGKITKALFKTNGDPFTIAGLEWICRAFEREDMDINFPMTHQQIMVELKMPSQYFPRAIALEKIALDAITQLKKRNQYE